MTQTLARYHDRPSRYILQPEENTLIRVAGPHQTPWEETTEIQNISMNGLAFTAAPELCPELGEMIKIQFEVPGSLQTACFGLVTRLESRAGSTMLVGVEFKKLEISHKIILAQSLTRKLREQLKREESKKFQVFKRVMLKSWKEISMAIIALAAWGFLFYVFSTILERT